MTDQITQANRLLELDTPLGKDKFILTGMWGTEEISQLFSYQLEMFSSDNAIAPDKLIGKNVSFQIKSEDATPRFFNGHVSQFQRGSTQLRGSRHYRIQIVPWLWFLTKTSNCRIFQNKTTLQIVEEVFKEYGFTHYDISKVSGKQDTREYCVQYQETAYHFVARLLQEEGIFFYFKHENGKHTLVLGNNLSAYSNSKDTDVNFFTGTLAGGHITKWERLYNLCPGKVTQTDYNYLTPTLNLQSTTNCIVPFSKNDKYELFEYPGSFSDRAGSEQQSKIRMQEEEVFHDSVKGSGTFRHFTPGAKFNLKVNGSSSTEVGTYLITSIRHTAHDTTHMAYDGEAPAYSNSFVCIPDQTLYRPAQNQRKAHINGVQTAIVVGPSGEDIFTDKYGRIKVQFHWDRKGEKNEKSSCWVRVAQSLAGNQFGSLFIPRVGQEVLVEFIEGDPDRPIVTGCVYNASQMPPYELPNKKTQSGFKTQTTKGGGVKDANELRFDDKKDSEEIYIHAQKDYNREVENDDNLTVKKGNRSITVEKGDHSEEIKQGNRSNVIAMGDDTLKISQGNHSTTISLGKSSTEAMQSIEFKVGQNSIKVDQTGITIQGLMVKINGQTMVQVNADAMLKLKGGITMIN